MRDRGAYRKEKIESGKQEHRNGAGKVLVFLLSCFPDSTAGRFFLRASASLRRLPRPPLMIAPAAAHEMGLWTGSRYQRRASVLDCAWLATAFFMPRASPAGRVRPRLWASSKAAAPLRSAVALQNLAENERFMEMGKPSDVVGASVARLARSAPESTPAASLRGVNRRDRIGCDQKWRSEVAQNCILLFRRVGLGKA